MSNEPIRTPVRFILKTLTMGEIVDADGYFVVAALRERGEYIVKCVNAHADLTAENARLKNEIQRTTEDK